MTESEFIQEVKKLYAEAGEDLDHWRTRARRDVLAAIHALIARFDAEVPETESEDVKPAARRGRPPGTKTVTEHEED